jgi:hypothetical protein
MHSCLAAEAGINLTAVRENGVRWIYATYEVWPVAAERSRPVRRARER